MDDFRKASPPFGGSMGEFGPRFASNVSPEQTIVFGSGAATNSNNSSNNVNFGGGGGGGAATKRGGRDRDRPRSASPISRPPLAPSNQSSAAFGGHQQDAAVGAKAFGKSPDQQREEEAAKARRLLRFGAEFGTRARPAARPGSIADDEEASMAVVPAAGAPLEPGSRGVVAGQAKLRDNSTQAARNDAATVETVDMDAPDNMTSEPILGICPDMCPESERNERERKGDLDRFERVGGNRNQTARDIAVKKYTRTAEKDAVLIRPLLVLKRTMGHLLSLLERDHEDDLLAVHSFLWDRMRAVRMDLRMQHIFTEEAIAMHEQMIRFHILAMHELCEFSEGEGISEVFNAHLNIEQMNKTSVDLFQMYDDHLKEGISLPSEAEFRGYYALLKLDKHPGYNVEPAELSLDLAKMTPEIRNSEQVRFARDVARACRASNFVAFFRLARDASYLQACLMHAHFSKLRTQALASLHSGLQKNQGIPLSTVVDWLGMEGEDIDALLKYHGFSIKYYEEAYMVKEGPFLNRNQDFPTCRAQLVEAKRSVRIVMDVQAEKHSDSMPQTPGELKRFVRSGTMERKGPLSSEEGPVVSALETLVQTKEEEMPDYIEEPIEEEIEEVEDVEDIRVAPVVEMVRVLAEEGKQGKKRRMDEPQFEAEEHERRRLRHEADAVARRAASQAAIQAAVAELKRKEEQRIRAGHDAEAYIGKQGIWFRKWRRRAASKALERHRKQLETEAALDTLSLGTPLWKMRVGGASVSLAQRTEYTKTLVEEQGLKLQQMWESLDIPNLVGPILQGLAPAAQSLAWRLVLTTPSSPSGHWVRTKVGSRRKSGTRQEFADRKRSDISIAEERVVMNGDELGNVVNFRYSAKDLGGADLALYSKVLRRGVSGLVFVMNEDEVVIKENARLLSLVQALPEAANVPLLVLSTRPRAVDTREDVQSSDQEISQWLKLGELSTSRVSKYRVISIAESSKWSPSTNVYFSDEALMDGIVWLAKLCPAQPQLRSLHVVDLIREHLDSGLKHLLRMPYSEVNPEHCINLFNQGIRVAANEIASSASRFPTGLSPSFFIDQKFTDEGGEGIHQIEGWSSKETLDALFADLNSCVLPPFPPFTTERNLGNINMQKLEFEQILLQYLKLVEGSSADNLTINWEVTRLVQRGCTIAWSESGMKLLPKWAQIFQAIFAERLLRDKPWPLVYIARTEKSPLQMHADENETSKRKITTGPDFSDDGQMLLDDMIGVSVGSDLASPIEEEVTEVVPSPPLQFDKESHFTNDSSHGTQSRLPSIETSNGRTLPKPVKVSILGKYLGYRLPQDSPLEWLVERDEESQAKRLRLGFTESECSLDKMMAELKRQGNSAAENVRIQKENHLLASKDLSPVQVHNAELEHQSSHLSEERGDSKGIEEQGSLKESNQVSAKNFVLALSPFEELLDKMVAASSRKGSNGTEQYLADMFTPYRRFCGGIEESRMKYQGLPSPD